MFRNLPLIVVANVLLLFINLYLLKSALNQNNIQYDSDNGYDTQTEAKTKPLLKEYKDLSSLPQENVGEWGNHVESSIGKDDVPKTGVNIIDTKKFREHEVRNGNPRVPNEPVADIYQKVFYNKTNPIKHAHHDWSFMRRMYTIPLLPKTDKTNCNALLSGSQREIAMAKDIVNKREFTKVPICEETYLEWTQNCDSFKQNRGYITVPLTEEEEVFPIAFSLSMFTDVEQMERLLRAVYQPQNLYCIHVDVKSSLLIHNTVRAIANCFDNVFMASQLSKVKWGDVSVLLPHLTCMKDLVKHHRGKWNYFIDLAGQEFPLRTNYEIVQILKIFNGSNDITASHRK